MRRAIKIVLWTLLGLTGLLAIGTTVLYIPPVQDFLRRQAVRWAEERTGLQIGVERVGLRFPLKLQIQKVVVVDTARMGGKPDTLLYVRRLQMGVQARPLLHGRVEVDGIGLEDVRVNSAQLLEGLRVEGRLGHFFTAAHGIDLRRESTVLDRVELRDAQMRLLLTDTTDVPPDTTPTSLRWKLALEKLRLERVAVDVRLPGDSASLKGFVEGMGVSEARADLSKGQYGWSTFQLEGASLDYADFFLRDIHAAIDSVTWDNGMGSAFLRELGLRERSGFSVTALTGQLRMDSTGIRLPDWRLLTPYSEIGLQVQVPATTLQNPWQGCLDARLDARVGKQDFLLLVGKELPETFRRDYPPHALRIRLEGTGNLDRMKLTCMEAELPGAFALTGNGEACHAADSLNRQADVSLQMRTGRLDFLHSLLTNETPETGIAIPDSMGLNAKLKLQGNQLTARLELEESDGRLEADARYETRTEAYRLTLATDALPLHHFLPGDSLRELSLRAEAWGRGTDFASPRTWAQARLQLEALQYGSYRLQDVGLTVEAGDSIGLKLTAGDLWLDFHAQGTIQRLLAKTTQWTEILTQQVDGWALDQATLRQALPLTELKVRAGTGNPLSDWLRMKGTGFEEFRFGFRTTPERGVNGRADVRGLRTDSLRLDSLFLAIRQDTNRTSLQGGVVNGHGSLPFAFRATLTGELRDENAELTLKYVDGEGVTGVLLGVNASPLTKGHGWGDGLLLSLLPEQPVIAYRRFGFADQANRIYLHRDGHVYAGVDMRSDDGIGLRLMSDRTDTVSLQNTQVAITRFRLSELSRVMPYLPQLTGLLSVEGQYKQTRKALHVTGKANVRQMAYEGRPVGDVGVDVSWLPREGGRHYLAATLALDSLEVMDVKGRLDMGKDEEMPLDLRATLKRLPLAVANVFLPEGTAKLAGRANGDFRLTGTPDKPQAFGSVKLDSASVYVNTLGARYYLSRSPIRLEDGRVRLDTFSIYTISSNPFTITGDVTLDTPEGPVADLRLRADNYTLLDARRTRESLVYGKVIADLDATVKGPINALTVRGGMHLLGTTNLTYVLTDSPLTVDDRLSGLVTFVSFGDTVSASRPQTAAPPGGVDLLMTVRIDDAVRLRADLSPDGGKYIELEGGGDLSLRYTLQGDMSLMGRYTLSDGRLKYSLPVIPLKEFRISRGSYMDWRGDVMNPALDLTAIEQIRASVAEGDNGVTRMVDFDVSVGIQGQLSAPQLQFDIAAPHDATVQNELLAMGTDERNKQAIAMLATGIYLNSGVKGSGLDMGAALNSVLQSQINSLAGQVKNASISVGVEDRTSAETGDKQTDYSFRYAQRFFNDRVQIVIGGKVSTGTGATNSVESFIDNISLEYRLDASGTRYVRAFYNKNYESVLDGEITETGVGLVLRRKVDRLGELFIFRKKEEE